METSLQSEEHIDVPISLLGYLGAMEVVAAIAEERPHLRLYGWSLGQPQRPHGLCASPPEARGVLLRHVPGRTEELEEGPPKAGADALNEVRETALRAHAPPMSCGLPLPGVEQTVVRDDGQQRDGLRTGLERARHGGGAEIVEDATQHGALDQTHGRRRRGVDLGDPGREALGQQEEEGVGIGLRQRTQGILQAQLFQAFGGRLAKGLAQAALAFHNHLITATSKSCKQGQCSPAYRHHV
mmetsp:Transcript_117729/g.375265  ORF Transcript_117729/g.375265 Transcript_117729/m.375265 type:complete len:241 (+) Transcript_117729:5735-6457(+)